MKTFQSYAGDIVAGYTTSIELWVRRDDKRLAGRYVMNEVLASGICYDLDTTSKEYYIFRCDLPISNHGQEAVVEEHAHMLHHIIDKFYQDTVPYLTRDMVAAYIDDGFRLGPLLVENNKVDMDIIILTRLFLIHMFDEIRVVRLYDGAYTLYNNTLRRDLIYKVEAVSPEKDTFIQIEVEGYGRVFFCFFDREDLWSTNPPAVLTKVSFQNANAERYFIDRYGEVEKQRVSLSSGHV